MIVRLFPESTMKLRSIAIIVIFLASTAYVGMNLLLPRCSKIIFDDGYTAKERLEAYISQAEILAPILIVDVNVLKAFHSDTPLHFNDRVKVAVERSFENERIAENEKLLEIIYYDKPANVDYWLFTDSNGIERAMLPFKIHKAKTYTYPARIEYFLQDWAQSRVLKCANVLKRPANITRKIPLSFAAHFAELRDFIKTKDNAHLITHCGTLLGWYRECSIIPHTTDVDFFIRSEEYSPKIIAALQHKKSPYKLFRIYGLPEDSYELAVIVKGAKPRVNIDLFSMYTTKKESWMGGLAWSSRKKYKWSYPRLTEFCTGDLLGHLIYIPCNVEGVLEAEYGDWKKDKSSSSFVWYKSSKNISPNGQFTKAQMKKMRMGY